VSRVGRDEAVLQHFEAAPRVGQQFPDCDRWTLVVAEELVYR
jgi:hypothetical protein